MMSAQETKTMVTQHVILFLVLAAAAAAPRGSHFQNHGAEVDIDDGGSRVA